MRGTIEITDSGIVVTEFKDGGKTKAGPFEPTPEGLREASRALASWMELPSKNPTVEARRIHRSETLKMVLKDAIRKARM